MTRRSSCRSRHGSCWAQLVAELHLLLVIDSETKTVRVAGLDEAPVDSKGAWDAENDVWRYPTEDELATLLSVEADILFALRKEGLYQ